jgi:hypothetical protein
MVSDFRFAGVSPSQLSDDLDSDRCPWRQLGDPGGTGSLHLQNQDVVGSLIDPGRRHPGGRRPESSDLELEFVGVRTAPARG